MPHPKQPVELRVAMSDVFCTAEIAAKILAVDAEEMSDLCDATGTDPKSISVADLIEMRTMIDAADAGSVEYVAELLGIDVEDAQALGDEIGVSDTEWDDEAIEKARALLNEEAPVEWSNPVYEACVERLDPVTVAAIEARANEIKNEREKKAHQVGPPQITSNPPGPPGPPPRGMMWVWKDGFGFVLMPVPENGDEIDKNKPN